MQRQRFLAAALLSATTGCGSSDDTTTGTGALSGQTYERPLYVIQSLVTDPDGSSSTYVILRPDLAAGPDITLEGAREFPSYAPTEGIDGRIVVANGEQPDLGMHSVSDEGVWQEEGTLSLSGYTSEPLAANVQVAPNKVYVPFEVTNHVTYDVDSLTLGREVGAPADIPLTRDGMTASRAYAHVLSGSTLFQAYYYADETFDLFSGTSSVAVIDTSTDTLLPSFDVPCPHLHLSTVDDDGNLYYSNGVLSVAGALLSPGHARNCYARVNAGETSVDPTSITYFSDLAEGREGNNLYYIGGGRALFNVYHDERDDLTGDDAFDVVDASDNYHLWTVDLATGDTEMLEGIDFSGGQIVTFRIDDRTLVTIPQANYSSTAFYEVPVTGPAVRLFEVQGWANKVFRVR